MTYSNPIIAAGQYYREQLHVKRFMRALEQPRKTQSDKLISIIRSNEKTAFGKKYKFDRVQSIEDFQNLVPPSHYEDLQPYIQAEMDGQKAQLTAEDPIMFATTSGTTGSPKYIPITPSHLRDYTHAFQIHNWALMRDNPKAPCVPGARYLIFTSNDCEGYSKANIPYGAVSGLLRQRQSPLVQRYMSLPHLISKIQDVQSKYYTILRIALCQRVVAAVSCNPSTLLLLADQMKEHASDLIKDIFDGELRKDKRPSPELYSELLPYLKQNREQALFLSRLLEKDENLSPKTAWPDLSVLSAWKGGPMSFYLDRLPEKYGDLAIRDFGYMASEGRGSIPLSNEGAGGVLALTSHFFEFVPEAEIDSDKKRFLCMDQLELGERYYIHFTTAAGLYRYNINDLVSVTGFQAQTPIIEFVRKGAGISSVTGEKLTEEQVHIALSYALRQLNLSSINHFTLAVQMDYPPFYTAYAEVNEELPDSVKEAFSAVFDQSLQLQNIEYKEKRSSGRLDKLRLVLVPAGTFTRLRQKRVQEGAPEAQVKIPFLSTSIHFKETLASL